MIGFRRSVAVLLLLFMGCVDISREGVKADAYDAPLVHSMTDEKSSNLMKSLKQRSSLVDNNESSSPKNNFHKMMNIRGRRNTEPMTKKMIFGRQKDSNDDSLRQKMKPSQQVQDNARLGYLHPHGKTQRDQSTPHAVYSKVLPKNVNKKDVRNILHNKAAKYALENKVSDHFSRRYSKTLKLSYPGEKKHLLTRNRYDSGNLHIQPTHQVQNEFTDNRKPPIGISKYFHDPLQHHREQNNIVPSIRSSIVEPHGTMLCGKPFNSTFDKLLVDPPGMIQEYFFYAVNLITAKFGVDYDVGPLGAWNRGYACKRLAKILGNESYIILDLGDATNGRASNNLLQQYDPVKRFSHILRPLTEKVSPLLPLCIAFRPCGIKNSATETGWSDFTMGFFSTPGIPPKGIPINPEIPFLTLRLKGAAVGMEGDLNFSFDSPLIGATKPDGMDIWVSLIYTAPIKVTEKIGSFGFYGNFGVFAEIDGQKCVGTMFDVLANSTLNIHNWVEAFNGHPDVLLPNSAKFQIFGNIDATMRLGLSSIIYWWGWDIVIQEGSASAMLEFNYTKNNDTATFLDIQLAGNKGLDVSTLKKSLVKIPLFGNYLVDVLGLDSYHANNTIEGVAVQLLYRHYRSGINEFMIHFQAGETGFACNWFTDIIDDFWGLWCDITHCNGLFEDVYEVLNALCGTTVDLNMTFAMDSVVGLDKANTCIELTVLEGEHKDKDYRYCLAHFPTCGPQSSPGDRCSVSSQCNGTVAAGYKNGPGICYGPGDYCHGFCEGTAHTNDRCTSTTECQGYYEGGTTSHECRCGYCTEIHYNINGGQTSTTASRPDGAPCSYHEDCSGQYCEGGESDEYNDDVESDTCQGTCSNGKNVGQSCEQNSICASKNCVCGICADENGNSHANIGHACNENSLCASNNCALLYREGQSCQGVCEGNLPKDAHCTQDNECRGGSHTGIGDNDIWCDCGYCTDDRVSGSRPLGAKCTYDKDCSSDYYCRAITTFSGDCDGECTNKKPLGGSCNSDYANVCSSNRCICGKCANENQKVTTGMPCVYNSNCQSGSCEGDTLGLFCEGQCT